MKIRFDIYQSYHIDPPLRFEDGVQVHPSTGKKLTEKQLQTLVKEREKNHATQYHVEFWTQPFRNWLTWKLYHTYDMAVVKFPGIYKFEGWLDKKKVGRIKNEEDKFFTMSWFANQDCRCYGLSVKNKTKIATVEIDEELYKKLEREAEDA